MKKLLALALSAALVHRSLAHGVCLEPELPKLTGGNALEDGIIVLRDPREVGGVAGLHTYVGEVGTARAHDVEPCLARAPGNLV